MLIFVICAVGVVCFVIGLLVQWSVMKKDYFMGFEDGLQNARKIYGYKKPERVSEDGS